MQAGSTEWLTCTPPPTPCVLVSDINRSIYYFITLPQSTVCRLQSTRVQRRNPQLVFARIVHQYAAYNLLPSRLWLDRAAQPFRAWQHRTHTTIMHCYSRVLFSSCWQLKWKKHAPANQKLRCTRAAWTANSLTGPSQHQGHTPNHFQKSHKLQKPCHQTEYNHPLVVNGTFAVKKTVTACTHAYDIQG